MAKFKAGDIIKITGAQFYLLVLKDYYVSKYNMTYYDMECIHNPGNYKIANLNGWSSSQTDENYEKVA
jgi:hypothetical protein